MQGPLAMKYLQVRVAGTLRCIGYAFKLGEILLNLVSFHHSFYLRYRKQHARTGSGRDGFGIYPRLLSRTTPLQTCRLQRRECGGWRKVVELGSAP